MNSQRFQGKADLYARYRPGYPGAYMEYLYSAGLGPGGVIADIGAGTGILSRLFLEHGHPVYCVEPNDEMRREAERSLAGVGRCTLVAASAERTGLAGGSIDCVTAAQAFHWFDKERFRSECRRILSSDGIVSLIWNTRQADDPLHLRIDALNRIYGRDFDGFNGGLDVAGDGAFHDFFRDGRYETRVFPHDVLLDEDQFIGRELTSSYSPRRGDPDYGAYVAKLEELFREFSRQGTVRFRMSTRSYTGRV